MMPNQDKMISRGINISVSTAALSDVPMIVSLRTSVARELTRQHGLGHWSSCPTEIGVIRALRTSRVLIARHGAEIVATLRLAGKKPWAIEEAYFANIPKALYLHDLAVAPEAWSQGFGRHLIEEAKVVARAWPSNAIRLDTYDASAGAAPFYIKCGFREVGRVKYRGVPLIYFEMLL
jgi:GNAT superfamily N-acetyltransferase